MVYCALGCQSSSSKCDKSVRAMPELLAFTAEHVCQLTGLSARQLRYWDATEFFSPEILDEHHRRAFGRITHFGISLAFAQSQCYAITTELRCRSFVKWASGCCLTMRRLGAVCGLP